MYAYNDLIHTHMHKHSHSYTHTCTNTHTHIHTHAQTLTLIYSHLHTHHTHILTHAQTPHTCSYAMTFVKISFNHVPPSTLLCGWQPSTWPGKPSRETRGSKISSKYPLFVDTHTHTHTQWFIMFASTYALILRQYQVVCSWACMTCVGNDTKEAI